MEESTVSIEVPELLRHFKCFFGSVLAVFEFIDPIWDAYGSIKNLLQSSRVSGAMS
jgi:hypothetical protein